MTDSPPPRRHLVALWNPSYAANALDEHASLLLRAVREMRAGERGEDEVYVWWGKIRSSNRQQPLTHLREILALDDEIESGGDDAPEVHLYVTDYRSLYVAHLAGVTSDDMSDEEGFVPPYYREDSLNCDCWFQLWDIRRLVEDDTLAVVHELAKLRNVRYHDRPVSLYGGMVELPLLVTRPDGDRYFDEATRDALTDGRYWIEFDAERGGTGAIGRLLREDRFGSDAWSALDPAARGFIATAEYTFRLHREDAGFDLSAVIMNLAKAFEVQVNWLLRRAFAGAEVSARTFEVDRVPRDLVRGPPLSLGQLTRAIGGDKRLKDALRRRLVHGDWVAMSLPSILNMIAELRNPAAHGEEVARDAIVRARNQLVGVGCKGDLLDLAQVRVREVPELSSKPIGVTSL